MTQKNNDDDDNFISLGFLIQKERIRELWKTNKTDRFIYPPHPHKMELLLTRNLVDKHNNYPDYPMIIITHTHTLENSELTCCSTDTHTHTNDCSRNTCGCILVLFFIVSIGNCYPKIKRFFFYFFGRHRQRWWRWWRRQVWLRSNFFFWLLLLLLEHTATTTTTTNHSCIFVGLVFHWFRPPVYYAVKKKMLLLLLVLFSRSRFVYCNIMLFFESFFLLLIQIQQQQ